MNLIQNISVDDTILREWEDSLIRDLNPPECVTTFIVFSSRNQSLLSKVETDKDPTRILDRFAGMKIRTLIDTGAP